MAKSQQGMDRDQKARQILAYREEQMLLYREMVKIHERLLADLTREAFPHNYGLDDIEASMKEEGIISPQHDV